MKGLNTLFFFLLFGWSAYSQSYNFTWQAIIRDDSGTVWSNKELRLKWSILNEQMALRYAEEHKVFTNSQGLITLKIGNGENKEGSLDRIDWSKEKLIIRSEVDLTVGRQFKNAMNHPLSVLPYAINAFLADSIKGSTSLSSIAGNGSFLYYDGQKWAGFPIGKPGQFLATNATGELAWGNPGTIPKLGELSVRHTGNDSLFINSFVEQESAIGLLSRGLVWDTIPNPTIKSIYISIESMPDLKINQLLTNWIAGKKYFIRAFATNAYGTGYSEHRTFEPGGEKCKDGDKLTLGSFHGDTIDIGTPLSFWVEEYDNLHSLNYELNGTKFKSSTYREDLENPGIDFWVRTEAFHKSGCRMLSDTLRFKVLDLSKGVNVISNLIISTNSGEKIYSYSTVDEIDVTGKTTWKMKVDINFGSDIVFLGRRKEGSEDETLGLTYAVPGRDTLYLSAEHTAYALLYLQAVGRKKTTLPAMETFMKSKPDFTTLVKMLDDELIKKGRLDLFSEEKNSLIAKLLDEWSLFPGAVENKETDERPSPLFLLPNPYTYGTPLEYDSGDKPYIYAVVAANPKTQAPYSDFLFRNSGTQINVDFYGLLLSVFMSPEYYIHNTLEKRIPSISSEVMGLPPLDEGVMDSFMIITQSGRNFKESHNIKGNTTALAANLLEYLIGAFEITPVGAVFKFIKQYVGSCQFVLYKSIWNIISGFIDSINNPSVWVQKVPSLGEISETLETLFSSLYKVISSFVIDIEDSTKGCIKKIKGINVPYNTFKKNLELWAGVLKAFDWLILGGKVMVYLTQPVSVEQIFYYMKGGIIQGRTVLSHNLNKNFFGMPGEFLTPDPVINFKQYEYVAKEAVVNRVNLGQGDILSNLVIKEKVGNLIPSGLNDNLSLRFKLGEATESIKFQNGKLIDNTGISKDHLVFNLEAENELKWKVGTQVKPGKDIYMGSMVEGYFLNKDNIDPLPNVLKAEIGTLRLEKPPYTKGGNFKVRVTTQDKTKGIEGVKVEFEVVEGEANLIAIASQETDKKMVKVLSDPTGECGVLVTGVKYGVPLKITAKILSSKGETLAMVYFPDPPEIITQKIDEITSVSARGGGFISKQGDGEIIERGLLWSKNPNPTIGGVDSKRTNAGSGVGLFSLNLKNLEKNTKYYVIAYAINEGGAIGFGEQVEFMTLEEDLKGCPVSFIEDFDGNVYPTVKIGTQCWMQSNLKVSKYRNGAFIPIGSTYSTWNTWNTQFFISGAYAIYANNNANDALYGKLYNWYAVNDGRGLCPTGWHVPSIEEWDILVSHLGGREVAGGKLKSVTGWSAPNTGATNESGFTGLPGGYLNDWYDFDKLGENGNWWSSSSNGNNGGAWALSLWDDSGYVYKNYEDYDYGLSVRCLRD
jgi:uncharacterized protein (TIGR02145 family)